MDSLDVTAIYRITQFYLRIHKIRLAFIVAFLTSIFALEGKQRHGSIKGPFKDLLTYKQFQCPSLKSCKVKSIM